MFYSQGWFLLEVESVPPSLPAPAGGRQAWTFLSLQLRPSNPCLCGHMASFPLCVSVFSPLKDTSNCV